MPNEISEKTLIPVSLVIIGLSAAVYIVEMHSTISSLKEQQSQYYNTVRHIDERLSRIEGKLGVNFGSTNKISKESVSFVPARIRPIMQYPPNALAALPRVSNLCATELSLCPRKNCPWENSDKCEGWGKCSLLGVRQRLDSIWYPWASDLARCRWFSLGRVWASHWWMWLKKGEWFRWYWSQWASS